MKETIPLLRHTLFLSVYNANAMSYTSEYVSTATSQIYAIQHWIMTNLIQYYNFKVSTSCRSFEGEAALLISATSQLHRRNSIQEIANASPATSLAGQIALRPELLCYSTD